MTNPTGEMSANEIALALMAVQLAQSWTREHICTSKFGRDQLDQLKALNKKLSGFLDQIPARGPDMDHLDDEPHLFFFENSRWMEDGRD